MVHDIVAMGGAWAGRLDRRRIDMADAEPGEIGQDCDRVVEGETRGRTAATAHCNTACLRQFRDR
ncbi:hypothetical protein ASE63_25000 [Bosea sp. Root381]|nr:hypothetical protein ASE63_25000 [Bosea sp. Root381]